MMEHDLKNKDYFKIGEVSKISGVKEYIIRYWVTELPSLKPVITPTGYRLFKKKDLETILVLKKLIYEEGLTLSGAKKRLLDKSKENESDGHGRLKKNFDMIKQQLLDLRKMFSGT
ncbi:MAG: MerR family transcriptional regulator [Deltaproteobacteria bacterium]|nr:MerR family transcriptional regulator [Deltaproteobacteria bacterium]